MKNKFVILSPYGYICVDEGMNIYYFTDKQKGTVFSDNIEKTLNYFRSRVSCLCQIQQV